MKKAITVGLSFRRSVKIGKHTRLNFSKSGVGVSTGVKGARVSVGPHGARETLSVPGTGIRYTKQSSWRQKQQKEKIPIDFGPVPDSKVRTTAGAIFSILFAVAKLALFLFVIDIIFYYLGVWLIGLILDIAAIVIVITGIVKKH